jgi:hypothetical protein
VLGAGGGCGHRDGCPGHGTEPGCPDTAR